MASVTKPQASSQQAAAMFNAGLAANATPNNVYRVSNAEAGNVNANFPVQLGSTDPQDQRYYLQQQLTNESGIVPKVGLSIVDKDFYDYAARKMKMTQMNEFQAWLMKQMSFDTPEQAEYWYTHFPWALQLRFNEIDRVSMLQNQDAKIQVAGPQTEDDWMFLFMKQKGLINIPKNPVHQLGIADYPTKSYIRGIFSPMITTRGVTPPTAGNLNKVIWNNPSANSGVPVLSAGGPGVQFPSGGGFAPYYQAPRSLPPPPPAVGGG